MQIREATENDIAGILSVLRASLGEVSSKKTGDVWKFKHISNPFGKSLVLIAVEGGEIIGVRAFMRWKWQIGTKSFSAFRAVDTATHPQHQGKGIFKKLTMEALKIGQQRGDHFVFNTPNAQSKPGYLKMGWLEVGKIKTSLVPVNPIYWNNKKNLFSSGNVLPVKAELLAMWNRQLNLRGNAFTPKTSEYLQWRYVNNPLQQYRLEISENFFIAGYIKERGFLKELRLSEIIISSNEDKKRVKKIIMSWAKESGANFISYSSCFYKDLFKTGITGNFGPVLTYKSLNLSKTKLINLTSWDYSLGDLELF